MWIHLEVEHTGSNKFDFRLQLSGGLTSDVQPYSLWHNVSLLCSGMLSPENGPPHSPLHRKMGHCTGLWVWYFYHRRLLSRSLGWTNHSLTCRHSRTSPMNNTTAWIWTHLSVYISLRYCLRLLDTTAWWEAWDLNDHVDPHPLSSYLTVMRIIGLIYDTLRESGSTHMR